MDKLNLINRYVSTGAEDDFEALTEEELIFWVDWREEDDSIIGYCEDILQTGSLSAEMNDTEDEIGFEINILHQGASHKIPYTGTGADRDTTLITLNEVLQPAYEIRFCIASDGGDTLAFLPLSAAQWQALEAQAGKEQVARYFKPLQKGMVLFG